MVKIWFHEAREDFSRRKINFSAYPKIFIEINLFWNSVINTFEKWFYKNGEWIYIYIYSRERNEG